MRKITPDEHADIIKRSQDLCALLQAEGADHEAGSSGYAMTILVHATALQAAFDIGTDAPRRRVRECIDIVVQQLRKAVPAYHAQFNKIAAAMKAGLN